MPVCTDTPKSDSMHARRHAEVRSGHHESQEARDARLADVQQNEERPLERAKHSVENDEDDENRQRDDDCHPRLSAMFAFVFAGRADAIAARRFQRFQEAL